MKSHGTRNAAGELDTVITNTRDRNIDGAPMPCAAHMCALRRPGKLQRLGISTGGTRRWSFA
jgi:hypothetical protein